MDPASIRLTGAVPLDPRPAASSVAPGSADSAGGLVVDVSEATFEAEVLARSAKVPVVVDFWADWCGPCKQLSPILEKLAAEAAGSWILAKIDVDANQRLAQAAQVQSIPAVKAVVNGQVVSEFTGALPESQVRQWLGQLVQAARAGTFGPMSGGPGTGEVDGATPPPDPDLVAADDALVAGDLVASEAAYQRLHDRPGLSPELRAEARGGLARVRLLRRAEAHDPATLAAAVAADPADVDAALGLADVLLLSERADEAFALLLDQIRRTADEERERVRKRLLDLFEVFGEGDEMVSRARRQLASALF